MNTMSITCICTHGGGGHMEACPLFTPSKEHYDQVRAARDKYRAALLAIKSEVESEPTTMVAATSIHDIVKHALG